MNILREDALEVINNSIQAVLPESAVKVALNNKQFNKNITVIAIGKAAWNMAKAAYDQLGDKIINGLVITKYEHSKGPIAEFEIIEAGHPLPDQNSIKAANTALKCVSELTKNDQILLLLSGGGSSLFEKPIDGVNLETIIDITNQLLSKGADIIEINNVRKHLSMVKGGRFGEACHGVEVTVVVLSDVIGDRLDVIASGPVFSDASTSEEALEILKKYKVNFGDNIYNAIMMETPKKLTQYESVIIGSVSKLCEAAAKSCMQLGYKSLIVTSRLECEAKEAGRILSDISKGIHFSIANDLENNEPIALVMGGETVVHLKGNGKGGRNQEIALSAAFGIEGLDNILIFSLGSDGTDGPTKAAGGIVDGGTIQRIRNHGIQPELCLDINDSYRALDAAGDLIITGATGTNVNDVMVALIGKK